MARASRTVGARLVQARTFAPQLAVRTAQAFVSIEASGGIVLLVSALVAVIWANSPAKEAYNDLWHAVLSVDAQIFALSFDLRHWVNDGLMTIFFFLVGLEIKRELVHGELKDRKRFMLPTSAAIGGMIMPALFFTALNIGEEGEPGWGIPMATDIAFAMGVLSLLGGRVPFGVKVFVLALAIVDDLGAIVVIAVFYTDHVSLSSLAVAVAIFGVMGVLNRTGVRPVYVYVLLGLALWVAMAESGVHPTIAGAAIGLLTPASPYYNQGYFIQAAEDLLERLRTAFQSEDTEERDFLLSRLEDLTEGSEAPLERLEAALHPWVSYLIVPAFALANAGVSISTDTLGDAAGSSITQGVVFGLLAGKTLGIFTFALVAVRLGLASLPSAVSWFHILGVSILAGIGFTVAIFIAGLAFTEEGLVDEAKIGIFVASIVAGAAGYLVLLTLGKMAPGQAQDTASASG